MISTSLLPFQVTLTKADKYTSGSPISFHWKSTKPDDNDTRWIFITPALYFDTTNPNDEKGIKMQLLHHVPVTLEQSSFILPQIFDHKQDVQMELWCSNLDFSSMLLCGISSSLTLQSNNNTTNHPFNNDIFSRQTLAPNTGANLISQVDEPDPFLDPAPPPPPPPPPNLSATIPVGDEDILTSPTASDAFTSTTASDEFASLTATDTLASPTTSDEIAEETKLPLTHDISVEEEKAPPSPPPTTCQVNVANPSCVPVVPSFIGPRTSSPIFQFGSKPDPGEVSNESKNTAGYGGMDGGTVAVIAIFSVLIVAMFLYWFLWHCHLKQRAKQVVGPYYYGSGSGVGGGGSGGHRTRSTRRLSSLSPNSNSSPLSPPPVMRVNRIIPPWSLTFVGDTDTGNSHYEEESAGGNYNGVEGGEGREEEGQAPSQGPPYHISSPVLVVETSFLEQCSQALELPFNQPHASGGFSRPVSPALMDSKYLAATLSAASADPRHTSATSLAPRPRSSSLTGFKSSPYATTHEPPPRRALSSLSNRRASALYRSRSPSPQPSSPSHYSLVSTHSTIFSDTDEYRNVEAVPTSILSPAHSHYLPPFQVHSPFQVYPPASQTPQRLSKNNNINTGDCRRENNDLQLVELPMPAALTQTQIQEPIRSVMIISSDDGQVLSRQEVLIRVEDNHNHDHDHDRNHEGHHHHHQHQHQRWHQIPQIQPNPQGYSRNVYSRRGLLRQPDFASLSSSDVPPMPAVPEKYRHSTNTAIPIPSMSSSSSPSPPPPMSAWPCTRYSKPIGCDPTWVDIEGSEEDEDGNWSRSRGMGSSGSGRSRRTKSVMGKRSEGSSKPQVRGMNGVGGYEQRRISAPAHAQVVQSGMVYGERKGGLSPWQYT